MRSNLHSFNAEEKDTELRRVLKNWEGLTNPFVEYNWSDDPDGLKIVCYPTAPVWFNKLFAYFQKREFLRCLAMIGDISCKKILEIGCGTRRWVKIMSDFSRDVTGIDIQKMVIERNRKTIPQANFLEGEFLSYDFGGERFDLIVSITFLQHLPYDWQREAVKKMKGLLKQGGSILMIENIYDHGSITFSNKIEEWINLFANYGFKCVYHKGVNYHLLLFLLWRLRSYFKGSVGKIRKPSWEDNKGVQDKRLSEPLIENLVYKPVVYLSYPLEYIFTLFPDRFALHSSFIFKLR